jgi:hypothetical protein
MRLQRASQQLEDEWDLRDRLLKRLNDMLDHPLYKKTITDGDRNIILSPSKWAMRDVVAMARVFSDLGRMVSGLSDRTDEMKGVEELSRMGWLDPDKTAAIDDKISEFADEIGRIISNEK